MTVRVEASIVDTVPSTMFVMNTRPPLLLTATPWAPRPVRIVSTTLLVATSITETVSAGSASLP